MKIRGEPRFEVIQWIDHSQIGLAKTFRTRDSVCGKDVFR